jgi:fructuronate reductase
VTGSPARTAGGSVDPGPARPVIAHLGMGNFHRAHQALYTLDAPGRPWAIVGVTRSNEGLVRSLGTQGHGYTVLTVDDDSTTARWADVHRTSLVARRQPDDVVGLLADPDTRVVTLTVTEKGYTFRPADLRLDLDDPDLRADLTGATAPRTTIGQLAAGLTDRARSHGTPISLVSCDNIAGNGPLLGRLLREFAAERPGADGSLLTAYLDTSVSTPASMVDRIVPATTAEHVALAGRLGYRDAVPVPAEPFSMWVLQDDFRAGRPAWGDAGVILTDDVDAWFLVKSSIVNGVHSLLAYTGLLLGHAGIADVVTDPRVRPLAVRLADEYAPCLDVPDRLDLDDYRTRVLRRFANRALRHTTAQVGSDGSRKLAQRVHHAVRWHDEHGSVPHVLAFVVAAWLVCTTRPDLVGDLMVRRAGEVAGPGELVKTVLLEDRVIGGELERHPEFVDRVADLVTTMLDRGVRAALEELADPHTRHQETA